ncbi:hypothetical protein HMPREF9997_01803 [Corynebacterium durum F0235]|uniref:Uncharacterized protein n=1 Tax=Corynebacterium durum F0235 TaxID=1035195 RepID=L1ME84_9CORY|nr:hypothetical protein HMPREF9997_01803 [Corynebacterium durum F0235]
MLLRRFLKNGKCACSISDFYESFSPLRSNDADFANLYINNSEIEDTASIVKRLEDNDA